MGQGGAQAIEDALSLGVFLSGDVQKSEVLERLSLYELARKERAHRVQQATRLTGLAGHEHIAAYLNFQAERQYAFCHDEVQYSSELLQKYAPSQ